MPQPLQMPYAMPPGMVPYSPYMQPYAPYAAPYAPLPQYAPQYAPPPYAPPPYYSTPYAPHAYAPPPYAVPPVPQRHKPPDLAQPPQHAPQHTPQPAPQPAFSQQLLSVAQVDAYGLPVVSGDIPVTYPQVFGLEEKVLGAIRGAFHIRDHQGVLRYKIDSKLSLHERKVLKDVNGHVMLKLREERLRLRDRITFFSPNNVPILTLQKASAVQFKNKCVNGYLGPETTGNPSIIITGNEDNTHFRIFNNQNQEVCNIRRRRATWKNSLTDQDSYDVTVNYGCPALMCFIGVALDEIFED
ncbi:unnamed protein product [Agarophyton chilense]